jgi:hypothetical protein
MLTPDEIRAVPLFASLTDASLDRLVRTAADIRLQAGECLQGVAMESPKAQITVYGERWDPACSPTNT